MSGATRFAAAGLTDAVLEAASSKGLVRRARRDVEAGLATPPAWEGGTAVVACDGETVRLPPGPLAGAACTCPAGGACRHILAAVILLREAPGGDAPAEDAPGAEADAGPSASGPAQAPVPDAMAEIRALSPAALAKAFGRAALVRAEALLASLDPAEVAVDARPDLVRIRLGDRPEVHVPAGAGPAGMVSKAAKAERAALHAAALIAVLRPEAVGAPPPSEAPPAGASAEPAAVMPSGVADGVAAVLRDAARQALSSAPAALEERIGDLALSSRVEAMPRLAAELRALAAALRRRRERREEDEPGTVLGRIARAYALAESLRLAPGDPALSGAGREAPAPLPETDFVGCGLELWRNAGGARGVTAHVIRVSDGRPFALTLARPAGADPGFSPLRAASDEAVFGQTAARLAGTAFRLGGAAAGADGRLSQREGRAVAVAGSWRAAIEAVLGAVISDWGALSARLGEAMRPALGETASARGLPIVLEPAAFGPLVFDAVAQAGRLPVADAAGAWLELEIAGERMEAHLEGLEEARRRRERPLLCVLARPRGRSVALSPIAYGVERLHLLDMPPARGDRKPAGFFAEWAKRFDATAVFWRGSRDEPRFEPVPSPGAARARLVERAVDEILALAELGGRMEDPERLARIEDLSGAFRDGGLETPARLLERLAGAPREGRAHHLLVAAYAIDALARLEPRLPFVRPA